MKRWLDDRFEATPTPVEAEPEHLSDDYCWCDPEVEQMVDGVRLVTHHRLVECMAEEGVEECRGSSR